VKLTDTPSASAAASGIAATPKMVNDTKNELSNPINLTTYTGSPALTGKKNIIGGVISSGKTFSVSGNNNILEVKSDGTATVSGSQQMVISQTGTGAILTA
jgi:hypothetical protein